MIRRGGVDFGPGLVIGHQEVKGKAGAKLRLAVLLRDLHVGVPEAPETAPSLPSEKGHQDVVFLPVKESKGLPGPLSFRVPEEALEESDNPIRRILIEPAAA